MPNLFSEAAAGELITALHGHMVRTLSLATGTPFEGCAAAGAFMRKRALAGGPALRKRVNRRAKKLRELDIACGWARHRHRMPRPPWLFCQALVLVAVVAMMLHCHHCSHGDGAATSCHGRRMQTTMRRSAVSHRSLAAATASSSRGFSGGP